MFRAEAGIAVGGVLGTIVAQAMPDASQMEAMAKWPLTLIMAVVAVVAIYLMYKGNRDNSKDRLEETKMHKESIEALAKSMTEHNALLSQRPCIRDPKND
jgi:phosphotransferase system  glucose/maltose/N-acetylglucosamine-specific IIC component